SGAAVAHLLWGQAVGGSNPPSPTDGRNGRTDDGTERGRSSTPNASGRGPRTTWPTFRARDVGSSRPRMRVTGPFPGDVAAKAIIIARARRERRYDAKLVEFSRRDGCCAICHRRRTACPGGGARAGVAQRSSLALPARLRGFNSRHPLSGSVADIVARRREHP